jgi:hypothetical protein
VNSSTSGAAAISQAAYSGAALRTGTLVGIAGTKLTVDIGGGQIVAMPYLQAYIPLLGDIVQIIQQGSVSLVLGAATAMPSGNVLTNPSFELDLPGATAITGWSIYRDPSYTGHAYAKVNAGVGWGALDGDQWFEIGYDTGGGANANVRASSDPIPVTPGEKWAVAAYVVAIPWSGAADFPSMALSLGFMASVAGVYPDDIIAESETQYLVGPTGPTWTPIRAIAGGGTVVPDGAVAMRVILDTNLGSGNAYWDKVICRKLS